MDGSLPFNLPFALAEYCCNDVANCFEMEAGCSDPYQAYTSWCNPLMCYNMSAKSNYMTTMQAASAIGGLYGLFMLVFVSIIWRICLACCRPHWKPPSASPAAVAATSPAAAMAAAAVAGEPQVPESLTTSPEEGDNRVTAAAWRPASGVAVSVKPVLLELSSVASANSALSNAHAPLTPAVRSMTPVPPTPQSSGRVGTAE
jgi:hypothetical protein